MMNLPLEVTDIIARMRQAEPCFQHVRTGRSLHLGFGIKTVRRLNGHILTRGEWQIGTYSNRWEVRSGNRFVCNGASDISIGELTRTLEALRWSRIFSICMTSEKDVRFEFLDNLFLEIQGDMEVDDEMFHIFYPPERVVVYQCNLGWLKGASNEAWLPTPIV
jgi:hypothetical protein